MDLKQVLSKAAAKDKEKEPEMVEVTRYIGTDGKEYWAKKAKTQDCMNFPLQVRLVVKGSKEDQ